MPMTAAELKRHRKTLNMTQTELAEALGVTRDSVARWEAETRQMSEPVVKLLRRLVAEHKAKED